MEVLKVLVYKHKNLSPIPKTYVKMQSPKLS